jgi:hypothetical protein
MSVSIGEKTAVQLVVQSLSATFREGAATQDLET